MVSRCLITDSSRRRDLLESSKDSVTTQRTQEPPSSQLNEWWCILESELDRMKFYAVVVGRRTGIFTDWEECNEQVYRYSCAKFKSFYTRQDAINYAYNFYACNPDYDEDFSENFLINDEDSDEDMDSDEDSYDYENSSDEESEEPITGFSDYSPYSTTEVYVDGAARGNGTLRYPISGYGVYFGPNDLRNAAVPLTAVDNVYEVTPTNQRAELHAIKHALKHIYAEVSNARNPEHYTIVTDSHYAQKAMTVWAELWEQRDWTNAKGLPVSNQDLIRSCLGLSRAISRIYDNFNLPSIACVTVKGHSGDAGNDEADTLANQGADLMDDMF